MVRTMSATEARINFGELMRRVAEQDETVIVERDGVPRVVVLSLDAYERMKSGDGGDDVWEAELRAFHEELEARLGEQDLPSSVEVIRAMRAERDEQLTSRLY